jgi:signal transduction histidine kinase
MRRGESGFGAWPVALSLLSGFAVVALGALFTARFLVRPLEKLSRTASALGRGDLRARTNLRRNDEVGDLARTFDEMAERIQSLLRVEKELMANVAHELRTPLARIRVALEIASEGDTRTARASLGEIAVDLAELETLVSDVLTTTDLELAEQAPSSRLPLKPRPISPEELAREAEARFRTRFPERELSVRVPGGLPNLSADPILMRRALDNLLENAQKYSAPSTDAIELSVSCAEDQVLFRVSDRGIGIPAADLPRVFSPFFRSERSRSRDAGGVGLGLTLVKQIVEAHAGSVAIASKIGSGTTVSVVLPLPA